jgi:hypothetical protein
MNDSGIARRRRGQRDCPDARNCDANDAQLVSPPASAAARRFLAQSSRHPAFRAKKYNDAENIWQARVNRDWRFHFEIETDGYLIYDLTPHPK